MRQRIIFAGRDLVDGQPLADCGIEKESWISKFPNEKEVLFARSYNTQFKPKRSWNKLEKFKQFKLDFAEIKVNCSDTVIDVRNNDVVYTKIEIIPK